MDYKNMKLSQIQSLWDEQMIYMCMGTQDNKIVNELAKEVKERNEMDIFREMQRDVIECYRR